MRLTWETLLKLLQEIPTQRQVMFPTQEDNRNWLWLSRLAFHSRRVSASRPILEEETAKEEEIANWEEEANKRTTMTVVNKTRIRTIMQVGSSFSRKEDIMTFISCMRCVIREGMVLWLCRGAWNELVYIGNSPHIPLGESSVRSRTFTLFYFIFSL